MEKIQNFFAVYLKTRILVIAFLGFYSGLPLALTFSTLSVWLAELGISKSTIGIFAAVGVPYTIKFLWSHLVDHIPIPLLNKLVDKRRAWIIVSQVFLVIGIIGITTVNPVDYPFYTALWALFISTSSATQDIAIDAYRVEVLEEDEQGAGAAVVVFGYRVGMLVSGAGALVLADILSWQVAYYTMAAIMGSGVLVTIFAPNLIHPKSIISALISNKTRYLAGVAVIVIMCLHYLLWDHIAYWPVTIYYLVSSFILVGLTIAITTRLDLKQSTFDPFIDFTKRQNWLLILLFIILYKLGDAFAGSMTNVFVIELGFSKIELGTYVKTWGLAATLIGAFIGGSMIGRISIIRSLWICGILQMFSNLAFVVQAYAGYNPPMLAATISIENLSGGMGTAVFVAYLSKLCNISYTATQYALLSSLSAFARTIFVSAIFYVDQQYFPESSFIDHIGWDMFFVVTTIAAAPGLVMLWLMNHRVLVEHGKQ